MDSTKITKYELIQQEEIKDIHSMGYLLRHKKSGARVMILENDDNNKVFNIAFRTPPTDNTGVAHILEHSVLCGSKKYPLKDPFVELIKGSLNTFLNAMTYPDKTMYPVASCNDKDFNNLMHVYLDAVFYPNIYQYDEIFRQEGWSYHLENVDGPLTYNGIVYSEMKGVFSSAEELLDRSVFSALFPDTPYGVESGGDPDYIPDLTYDEFLHFHKRYYHPSNSYIYLYGDMDMEERLDWMDREYLSQFNAIIVPSEIPYQKAFEKPHFVTMDYPVGDEETLTDNDYLSYNVVVGDTLNIEESVAFEILDYALLSSPGAPLKQALLDAKIGKDVYGAYNDGILQPFFSVVAKSADNSRQEEFLAIIQRVLQEQSKELNHKVLEAGINYYEFQFREADYGTSPKGLMYGINAFDSWLYDDTKPFAYLHPLSIFASLKEKVKENYFEALISKYLLGNTHAVTVTMCPKHGLVAQNEERIKEKLAKYKASLSGEALEQLFRETIKLKEYQDASERPEDIEKLPVLAREDIDRHARRMFNEKEEVGGCDVIYHEIETNGIAYLDLMFKTSQVPEELIPYLGILKSVIGAVDTEHYTYAELFNEINTYTGGIVCGVQVYDALQDDKDFLGAFGVRAKMLYSQIPFAFKMIREMLFTSKLTDDKRLFEIVSQQWSRAQNSLTSAGHATAILRGSSHFSREARYQEMTSGIEQYRLLSRIVNDWESELPKLRAHLQQLIDTIFTMEHFFAGCTATREGYQIAKEEIGRFAGELGKEHDPAAQTVLVPDGKSEAFTTSGQVQYVAKVGNFVDKGFTYTGVLRILKVILGYDYLWNNIRVKGGAYGCMTGFKRNGDSFFVSYRDPKLRETIDVYDHVPQYLEHFDASERDMTKYVIGTISALDVPLTPATLGEYSMMCYMKGATQEDMQREKEEILDATAEDIRALAPLVRAVLEDEDICVVGSGSAIHDNAELFDKVEALI